MKEFFKKLWIFGRIKRVEEENALLKKEVQTLKEIIGKKTISQKTTEDEPSVPFSQIVDEWLNGEEEVNG